jgi:hypothetical protein
MTKLDATSTSYLPCSPLANVLTTLFAVVRGLLEHFEVSFFLLQYSVSCMHILYLYILSYQTC